MVCCPAEEVAGVESLGEGPSPGVVVAGESLCGSLAACWGKGLCWGDGSVVGCAGKDCEGWGTDTLGGDGSDGVKVGCHTV